MKPWEMFKSQEPSVEAQQESPKPWEMFKSQETPEVPKEQPQVEKEPSISLDLSKPSEQFGYEVPGTVQAEDTSTTMTLPEVEQSAKQRQENIEYPKQVVAGMRQSVSLPAAKVVEDSLAKLGIDVGTESSKNLSKINKYIKKYNDSHPDQVIHPATIGNIASQLVVPASKGIKSVAATEAILNALDGIGKREDYDDVAKDAAVGAAFGAGSMALFNRLTRDVGPLSYEAKILIDKHPELNEEDVLKALDGVPKADQAYALANMVDDDFVDFTAKSLQTNRDKLLLKQQLADRTKLVKKTIGNVDKQVEEAKDVYSKMVDEVAVNNPNVVKFDSMLDDLDKLVKRYDKTPSRALSIVNNMKADIEAGNGFMDVRTALQFRKDLNYLIDKSTRYEEKKALNTLKGNVDKFISENVDSETLSTIDNAITNYRRAMNNRDFIDIMDKFVKKKATDWVGLKKALKKEKLSSPEVDDAIDIVKEFGEKFKNDKQLRTAVKTKGQQPDAGGALSTWSYAVSEAKDALRFFGERYRELKVQKAILKSIRQAKSPLEAFKNMERNSVPPKLRKDMQKALLLEYKPRMKTTGDVDLYPKYVSKEGTVGSDASQVALHDAQRNLVREALGKNYSDEVVEQTNDIVHNMVNGKRPDKIMKMVSQRMKADDKAGNMKMLKKIIDRESDLIVKRIQKDLGIKLPKSEAEKIYKLRLDDMLKECE